MVMCDVCRCADGYVFSVCVFMCVGVCVGVCLRLQTFENIKHVIYNRNTVFVCVFACVWVCIHLKCVQFS